MPAGHETHQSAVAAGEHRPVAASQVLPHRARMTARTTFDIVYVPLGSQAHGGAERSLLDLATRFAARGERVLVLVGPELGGTDFVDEAARRGLAVQRVDWTRQRSRWHNLRAAYRVWRAIDAQLIHFNISWHRSMWIVAAGARLLTRARLVGSMRAMPDPHELVPRRRYLGFIPGLRLWHLPELTAGWLWGRILHITVSVNARDFPARLVEHYGYPADRIAVIYNGIDVNLPAVPADSVAALRRQAGAAEGDFLVALVGRLEPGKGADLLLRAIAPLAACVRAVLVGEGDERPALEALAGSLGLRSRVHFAGYAASPEGWMAAADVVAVPSQMYEAFGRVVIEAMAQAKPVVASHIGGMAELFDDGVHGKYVPAGDVEHLRRAIAALSADPTATGLMGRRARQWICDRYSLERVEEEHALLYRRLRVNSAAGQVAARSPAQE
jgi:glycosyltransferase involved in cell wall biosynthesis